MAAVQFEPEHKRLLARYKQAANPDVSKAFLVIDLLSKRLATKDLAEKERDRLRHKLEDGFKKLKIEIKDDVAARTKRHTETLKNPPDDFDASVATRVHNNVKRELLALEKKVKQFSETGGEPPPPPKLPEFHFGADYKRLIAKFAGTLSPAVVSALDKLDENHDAAKAMTLIKAVRTALDSQTTSLTAELGRTSDQKEKVRLGALIKELQAFRADLKQLENRIFLIHRLKT